MISTTSSQLDHTITASIADVDSLDRTITPGPSYDSQSLYSEQSLSFVEAPSIDGTPPPKPPRGSFRVEKKPSRKLPSVPKPKTPNETTPDVMSPQLSSPPLSSPLTSSPAIASPVMPGSASQQPASGTVRKASSPSPPPLLKLFLLPFSHDRHGNCPPQNASSPPRPLLHPPRPPLPQL
jgi:hypothetical protein